MGLWLINDTANNNTATIIFIVLLVVLIIALLVIPMFTNKKRAKQTEELHRSLKPGDLIKTVGGIIGTIKDVRTVSPVDKEMVIETGEGDNKTTMVLDIQALYQVISRAPSAVAVQETSEDTASAEAAPAAEQAQTEQPVAEAPTAEQAEPAQEQTAPEQTVEPAAKKTVGGTKKPVNSNKSKSGKK